MGFLAGFAGGITLTLSLTYLALLTHTHNRQSQSALLRAQASTLDTLLPPAGTDPTLPLSSRQRNRRNTTVLLPDGTYRPRESLLQPDGASSSSSSSFLETAKTKWNSEVLSAVRWAQTKDWARVREEAEEGVARVLGIELSKEEEERKLGTVYPWPTGRAPAAEAEFHGGGAAVGDTLQQARDTTVSVAQAMRDEARGVVSEAVEEARGAVSKGMEKAHGLVEKTKAMVHLAEDKAEGKVDARMLHVSAVEKALAERYDSARREERMKRSAEEVLRDRYIPMDGRDNSQLRGI
ncbi:hypothetical protein N658DRAFT_521867 [Parathielavia hyrcaniae]|uniref:MICOS complex subunit MIC12 n=1 Tax=Parathielavia hyrcaniae TaxID=113614 RepID=A0AAN6Q5P3_9PEZI|nr:hypothetical protein N658DRAFT_521867 [Parathielavia hyrcaniae]